MFKRFFSRVIIAVAATVGFSTGAQAATCPTTSNTNTDCAFLLTIAADGSITGSTVTGASPYDGSDDSLVGVVNNMATPFTGSIKLSGAGDGGGLFAFEGDGICLYTGAAYCSGASTGYEGPNNTFANINGTGTSGDIVFNVGGGIPAGGTSFFSLESSPSSITQGGGILVGGAVPEPAIWAMLLIGFFGIGGALRSSRRETSAGARYA